MVAVIIKFYIIFSMRFILLRIGEQCIKLTVCMIGAVFNCRELSVLLGGNVLNGENSDRKFYFWFCH